MTKTEYEYEYVTLEIIQSTPPAFIVSTHLDRNNEIWNNLEKVKTLRDELDKAIEVIEKVNENKSADISI